MANNSIIASVRRTISIPRTVREMGITINGNVYKRGTWDELERMTRTPGVNVTYHGTEVRLSDDWGEQLYRIFQITKTGRFEVVNLAVEA